MKHRNVTLVSILITAVLFIALGVFILSMRSLFQTALHIVISTVFVVLGLIGMISFASRKHHIKSGLFQLISSVLSVLLGCTFFAIQEFFFVLFPIVFSLYVFAHSLVWLVSFIRNIKEKGPDKWFSLLTCSGSFIIGSILLSHPFLHIRTVFIISAIYLIAYGLMCVKDFLMAAELLKPNGTLKRHIRINLPLFLTMLIPHRVLTILNRPFNRRLHPKLQSQPLSGDSRVDMEIFIHVSDYKFGKIGHVDLFFDNRIIAYGTYDESTQRVQAAFGDGVLFFAPDKETYINFCMEHNKKTLFGFGLQLTDEQKEKIQQQLDVIMEEAVPWQPLAQQYPDAPDSQYTDYASCLYRATHATFYKFKSGKFKRYFALKDNCVQLIEMLLGSSGIDLLGINGIIMPGTYYHYFERKLAQPGSMVVNKTVYRR